MKKRIIIADDDPTMRSALDEALLAAGYQTLTCPDGDEASRRIQEGGVDLVISDVRMPGMNGLDLLRSAQSRGAHPPFIMISGYATVPEAVEAMKMGVFDFLVKPFSYRELVGLVQSAMRPNGEAKHEPAPQEKGKAIVSSNPRMQGLLRFAADVAKSQASVLIQGESGTGKELLARYIHNHSRRCSGPFVAVNCAALPEGLLESELFGYERGAFTGAVSGRPGKFELADTGTLLLDEIGEIPLGLQAKLLRALQEREVEKLGAKKPLSVDIRVIATTNRELQEMVNKGTFREDLFYRLNVIPLRIPPLRERLGDIEALARDFFGRSGYIRAALTPQAAARLMNHVWKGNVRELFNVLERAVIVAGGGVIGAEHLFPEEGSAGKSRFEPEPPKADETPSFFAAPAYANGASLTASPAADEAPSTVRQMEKRLIMRVLGEVRNNRKQAAEQLGISVRTLRNKLKLYREEA
jgi:two-component system response regulator FlrC